MSRLAYMVCGVNIPFGYPKDDDTDRRLLNDILYPKTRKDKTTCRFMTRVHLVRNIFRNSWKYRMFSDMNFLVFCGRRVWGFLFDKDLD